MVDISIHGDIATFQVLGIDKLWALRSKLEVPLVHIKGAIIDTSPAMGWFQGLKVIGTDLPNVFRAGTFYQEGHLVFWDVYDPHKTIVVELEGEHFFKLIIEVADPEEAVALITKAIGGNRV